MKISELFEQEPQYIETGITKLIGCYYNHIPEVDDNDSYNMRWQSDFAPLVECVIFYQNIWDARRSQVMYGVRYNGEWVMLCRNAGRELDDYASRQIVNLEAYHDMIRYILTEIAGQLPRDEILVVPLDTEVETHFYGFDVTEPYPYTTLHCS